MKHLTGWRSVSPSEGGFATVFFRLFLSCFCLLLIVFWGGGASLGSLTLFFFVCFLGCFEIFWVFGRLVGVMTKELESSHLDQRNPNHGTAFRRVLKQNESYSQEVQMHCTCYISLPTLATTLLTFTLECTTPKGQYDILV